MYIFLTHAFPTHFLSSWYSLLPYAGALQALRAGFPCGVLNTFNSVAENTSHFVKPTDFFFSWSFHSVVFSVHLSKAVPFKFGVLFFLNLIFSTDSLDIISGEEIRIIGIK